MRKIETSGVGLREVVSTQNRQQKPVFLHMTSSPRICTAPSVYKAFEPW